MKGIITKITKERVGLRFNIKTESGEFTNQLLPESCYTEGIEVGDSVDCQIYAYMDGTPFVAAITKFDLTSWIIANQEDLDEQWLVEKGYEAENASESAYHEFCEEIYYK